MLRNSPVKSEISHKLVNIVSSGNKAQVDDDVITFLVFMRSGKLKKENGKLKPLVRTHERFTKFSMSMRCGMRSARRVCVCASFDTNESQTYEK